MKEKELVKSYNDIKKDYIFDPSIFNQEPEKIAIVKDILNNVLSDTDRTIILLYIDCLSYRKLGKRMGLSHMTIRRECLRIKAQILEEYNKRIKENEHLLSIANSGTDNDLHR